MLQQVFVTLAIAMCLMHSATAIKCYQCKSLTDPNCGKDMIDASSNIRVVDCDTVIKPPSVETLQAVTKCNKVVTSDRAGKIVSRDCHFEAIGQKSNECTVTHSAQVESCKTCTGDMCNGGQIESGATTFVAFSAATFLALFAVQLAL